MTKHYYIPDDGFSDGGEPYDEDELDYINNQEYCPVCDGESVLMGSLGRLNWYRCVNCGMEFNQERE